MHLRYSQARKEDLRMQKNQYTEEQIALVLQPAQHWIPMAEAIENGSIR